MKKAAPYIFALLSTAAVTIDTLPVSNITAPFAAFNASSLTAVVLFAAFCLLFRNAEVSKASVAAAAVIALGHIIGRSFFYRDSLYMICGSKGEAVRSFVIFLGITVLLAVLIEKLFDYFKTAEPDKKPLPFLTTWTIIFACWIPYLLCRPPLYSWDTMAQVDMFFGRIPPQTAHPVASMALFGLFAKLGTALGSAHIGMCLLSLCQSLGFSAALAYCVTRLKAIPRALSFIFIALFAVAPQFSLYGVMSEKSIIYALFILLFTVFAYDALKGKPARGQVIGLILSSVMCVLMRPNGIHVILPALIVLFFGKSASKKQIAIATIITLCVYILVNGVTVSALRLRHGRVTEAMSLPLQQTARYAVKYSAETPQSEKDIINKIVNYDTITLDYYPELADPVKGGSVHPPTKEPPTKEDLANYFSVWAKQFVRHPAVYAEATLNNTYTYFSFFDTKQTGKMRCFPHVHLSDEKSVEEYAETAFDHVFPDNPSNRCFRFLGKAEKALLFAPLFAPLCRPALYTCFLVVVIAFAVKYKKRKVLAVSAPSILSFLVCVASPVNGDFRYAIAYAVCVPFLLGICFDGKEL